MDTGGQFPDEMKENHQKRYALLLDILLRCFLVIWVAIDLGTKRSHSHHSSKWREVIGDSKSAHHGSRCG